MVRGWLAVIVVLAGAQPVRAEWPDGERRTAAYFWHEAAFEEIVQAGWPNGGKPERIAEAPFESRFLRAGDELRLMVEGMRRLQLLEDDGSQAVYNASTKRMVVRATKYGHLRTMVWWERLKVPRKVALRYRLLKVRCRECEGVNWTAERVQLRLEEELAALATFSSPDEQVRLTGGEPGGIRSSVEAGAALSAGGDTMDVNFLYRAALPIGADEPGIELAAHIEIYAGCEVFVELGSTRDAAHTLLLGVEGTVTFEDGTPLAECCLGEEPEQWTEFFNELRPRNPVGGVERRDPHILPASDGHFLGVWNTLLSTLESGVAAGPARIEVEAPPGIPGVVPGARLLDVAQTMRESGVEVPEKGWALYDKANTLLFAKMEREGLDLVEQLCTDFICMIPPSLLRVSASLVEWDGPVPEPGRLPGRLERISRVAGLARPGGKISVELGHLQGAEVGRGIVFEAKPNQGAEMNRIELDYALAVRDDERTEARGSVALVAGRPVLMPVSEENGRRLGLVLEALLTDATGADVYESMP